MQQSLQVMKVLQSLQSWKTQQMLHLLQVQVRLVSLISKCCCRSHLAQAGLFGPPSGIEVQLATGRSNHLRS